MKPPDALGAAETADCAINHIFGCGLTLAGILGRPDVSHEVARRLHDVIDELDTVVTTIQRSAFTALAADREPHPDAAEPHAIVPDEPAPVAAVMTVATGVGCRRLSRFANDAFFAYAMHGHDFYRSGDDLLWAHESDGLLVSPRTGTPFARRDGRVFLDLESNVPLYYEDGLTDPHPGVV